MGLVVVVAVAVAVVVVVVAVVVAVVAAFVRNYIIIVFPCFWVSSWFSFNSDLGFEFYTSYCVGSTPGPTKKHEK